MWNKAARRYFSPEEVDDALRDHLLVDEDVITSFYQDWYDTLMPFIRMKIPVERLLLYFPDKAEIIKYLFEEYDIYA